MKTPSSANPHASLMDRIYARQRHVYDATRKYYLLGRDRMIEGLDADAKTVLEVGCGTGRNLISASRRFPSGLFFGFDISDAMLATARRSVGRAGLDRSILLTQSDALEFRPAEAFAMRGFDRVFLSYTLSMMPGWQRTIQNAFNCLNPGGSLHIVDFGQQRDLPPAFRSVLLKWLEAFHVTPREPLVEVAGQIADAEGAKLEFERLYRDYAWHLIIKR